MTGTKVALSDAIRKAKVREMELLNNTAVDLKTAIEADYTRMPHDDFHRLIWPIITSAPGTGDMSIIAKIAKSPMAPIIVVNNRGEELYRLPPLWNTRNLHHRPKSRSDSISVVSDNAAMRASSGHVAPGRISEYIVGSIMHLVETVEISEEDRNAWALVVKYNAGEGRGTFGGVATTIKPSSGVELDGEYEDF